MAISKSLGAPAGFAITLPDGTVAWVMAVTSVDAAGATADAATQTTLAAVLAALTAGQKASSASLSVVTSKNQDPIFDHANGTKTSVTASATILTPPAACLYARVSSDVDIYVNTAGNAAVDDGTSIRILANVPEIIPVTAAVAVKALSSSGTATVRCTPMITR